MGMKYKIYHERYLLVDVLDNTINLRDLKHLFDHEITNEHFPLVKRVLSDISKSDPEITSEEIYSFVKMIISPIPPDDFRWAILTKEPLQAALSFLVMDDKFFRGYVGVFSTMDAAVKFLDVTFHPKELNDPDYIFLE
jgi:hypothetical protein